MISGLIADALRDHKQKSEGKEQDMKEILKRRRRKRIVKTLTSLFLLLIQLVLLIVTARSDLLSLL